MFTWLRFFSLGIIASLLCCKALFLHGTSFEADTGSDHPWFTGALLTPSALVLSPGQGNVEPYLFWTANTGFYDNEWGETSAPIFYQLNPSLVFQFGIFDGVQISGFVQSYCNWTQGVVGSSFGDAPLSLSFQILKQGSDDEPIYGRLIIGEMFPLGRYQKLKPHKLKTDAGGLGSFRTRVSLVFSKQFKYKEDKFLRLRWFGGVEYYAPVHVKGLNIYGGDNTTKGTVYPGVELGFLSSAEYTLTRNWTLACDFEVNYHRKTRFSGRTVAPMGFPLSVQMSLAPAIEYNWNSQLGLIVGPWFTIAGKNTLRFINLVAGLNYDF